MKRLLGIFAFVLALSLPSFAAGELKATSATGGVIYGVVTSPTGQVSTGANAFAVVTNANYLSNVVTLSEQGTTGFYLGDFPVGITTPGRYTVLFYRRVGSTPALGDTPLGPVPMDWTGAVQATLNGLNANILTRQPNGPVALTPAAQIANADAFINRALPGTQVDGSVGQALAQAGQAPNVFSIASAILTNANNKITTNPSGQVTTSNPATGGGGITITDVQTALTNQGYTTARAAKLDNLDAAVSAAKTLTPTERNTLIAQLLAATVDGPDTVLSTLAGLRALGWGRPVPTWSASTKLLQTQYYRADGVSPFILKSTQYPLATTLNPAQSQTIPVTNRP